MQVYVYWFIFGLTKTSLPGEFGSAAKMNTVFVQMSIKEWGPAGIPSVKHFVSEERMVHFKEDFEVRE